MTKSPSVNTIILHSTTPEIAAKSSNILLQKEVDERLTKVKIQTLKGIQSASGYWYKVLESKGSGGNGRVYRVLCTNGPFQGCTFALKILANVTIPERKKKFFKERQFLRDCDHPSIMRHFDEGVWNGHPFFVMEYMPVTLDKELRTVVPLREKLLYALNILLAVVYLHSKNILHRDIKPGNIFVPGNAAYLGDFGLIKELSCHVPADKDVKGYFAMPRFYRTPELVCYARNGKPLVLASDVFQVGLVFSELFFGHKALKPYKSPLENVELFPIPDIDASDQDAPYLANIRNAVNQMLEIHHQNRISSLDCLGLFNKIFSQYSRHLVVSSSSKYQKTNSAEDINSSDH